MPHLFGPIGKTSIAGNLARLCLRKEFHLLSRDRSSPITDWIRQLCRHIRDESGTDGVGIIGMCLTGNFAIQLIGDESVLAVHLTASHAFFKQGSLHMSPADIEQSRQALDSKGPMRLLRFDNDPLCTAAKSACILKHSMTMAIESAKLRYPGRAIPYRP